MHFVIENDMSNVWAHSHSTIYTRKIAKVFQAPNVGNCREKKKAEFGDMYPICNMYAVAQSIGIKIINRSFAPYTELRLPGQGVQWRDMKSLDSELLLPSWVDVVPELTIAKNRIEGGKKKK